MRLMRRGVIAQRKGGFVWAVYEIKYSLASSSTGSFQTGAGANQRYASKNYSIGNDGVTISLVSPALTRTNALTVGHYVVSTAANGDYTNTSGSIIYKITKIEKEIVGANILTGYIFSYTSYKSKAGKGDDTGTFVESTDVDAYPANGQQGDYWYVLIN